MARKKKQCLKCGTKQNLKKEEGVWFCEDCLAGEDFCGMPVLHEKLEICPCCKEDIDFDRVLEDFEEVDTDRAIACGEEVDAWGNPIEKPDQIATPYLYIYELNVCNHCDFWIGYGRRYYWNEESGNFDLDAPLTPAEKIAKENAYQESMGQQIMEGF